jgi:hypothetical protein
MKKILTVLTRLVISVLLVVAIIYAIPFVFYCLGQFFDFIGFIVLKYFNFISIYFEEYSAVIVTGTTIFVTIFAILTGFLWSFGLLDEEQKDA